ncbi:hypothetical protein [Salidesulfovibrio onnuriiensis]|uniref:hypothetical protein n=1 Tax=Salidesulfovibrio onnuriiensis TaxID=2583823 RepID=UPI0011CC3ED7|nr:hypothetical protein [Salidesulfovibrio onnuriiensis]
MLKDKYIQLIMLVAVFSFISQSANAQALNESYMDYVEKSLSESDKVIRWEKDIIISIQGECSHQYVEKIKFYLGKYDKYIKYNIKITSDPMESNVVVVCGNPGIDVFNPDLIKVWKDRNESEMQYFNRVKKGIKSRCRIRRLEKDDIGVLIVLCENDIDKADNVARIIINPYGSQFYFVNEDDQYFIHFIKSLYKIKDVKFVKKTDVVNIIYNYFKNDTMRK